MKRTANTTDGYVLKAESLGNVNAKSNDGKLPAQPGRPGVASNMTLPKNDSNGQLYATTSRDDVAGGDPFNGATDRALYSSAGKKA